MTTATTVELLSTEELAVELGIHPVTLCRWRNSGYGPRFARVGSRIRYRRRDVDRWLDSRSEGKRSATHT